MTNSDSGKAAELYESLSDMDFELESSTNNGCLIVKSLSESRTKITDILKIF